MSTSILPPLPGPRTPLQEHVATSPSRQCLTKSPPLPKLPRYFYVTRTYKPRRICTCDTLHEKTYFQPLLICRAYKCPVRYYHAQCVAEVPLHPLDPTTWYCQHCRSDDVIPARICVCGEDLPSPSRPMVQCSRKGNCRARWYHKTCVETPEKGEEWVCFECQERGREKEEERQRQRQRQQQQQQQFQVGQPERQPRQELQQQNQQMRQSRQSQQAQQQHPQQKQPFQQSRQPQQSQQTQQKRKKRQHQNEPEDDDDTAPSKKRVRFCPDEEDKRPVMPGKRRNAARLTRSQPDAGDPQEQGFEGSSPEEVEYCFCAKPSSMQMVACDGKKCAREWFHFECVGMTKKTVPKGKWYCDECGVKKTKGVKATKAKKVNKKGGRMRKR